MDSRNLPEEKWSLFFSALLSTESPNFEIKLENDKIIIKTPEQQMAEKLSAVLSSPEMTRANLKYSLTTEKSHTTTTVIQEIHYPKSISIEQGAGEVLFEKIIGRAQLRRIGCPQWTGEVKPETFDPDRKVLYATADQHESLSQIQVDTFRDLFRHASYADFRDALAESPDDYQPLVKKTEKGILNAHINKILYKKDDTLYFDYGLLSKCLIAPIVTCEVVNEVAGSHFEIAIDKNHLISYLSTAIKEGFILHVTGNAHDATQQARPICFNMGQALPVDITFSFLLDCSYSMESGFSQFKTYIKDFIKLITQQEKFKNAVIKITPFETTMKPTKTFSLKELKSFKAIDDYFEELKVGGATDLDNTICTTLQSIGKNPAQMNDIVFICTDGVDSSEGKHTTRLTTCSQEIKRKSNPPKLYSIGFGRDYDEVKLRQLAEITGCEHIKLTDQKDLERINEHLNLDHITKARVLATFIQAMEPIQQEFTVVTVENELGVGTKTLTIPGDIVVNGERLYVEAGKPELIAVATAGKAVSTTPATIPSKEELFSKLTALNPADLAKLLAGLSSFKTVVPTVEPLTQAKSTDNRPPVP